MIYDKIGPFLSSFLPPAYQIPLLQLWKIKTILNILNLAHPRNDELKDYCRIKDIYIFSSNAEAEAEN